MYTTCPDCHGSNVTGRGGMDGLNQMMDCMDCGNAWWEDTGKMTQQSTFTMEMFDQMVQSVDELVIVEDENFPMELRFDKSDLSCDVPYDSDTCVWLSSKMIKFTLQLENVSSYSFTPPYRLVLFVT